MDLDFDFGYRTSTLGLDMSRTLGLTFDLVIVMDLYHGPGLMQSILDLTPGSEHNFGPGTCTGTSILDLYYAPELGLDVKHGFVNDLTWPLELDQDLNFGTIPRTMEVNLVTGSLVLGQVLRSGC